VKAVLILLLQLAGLVLIAAAGFTLHAALGLLVLGAGAIVFSLAWERN
jgi:hypothetical protein